MEESIFYKKSEFEMHGDVISWVQKFMEIYLSKFEHPDWFRKELEYISWNFHVPNGKLMFDDKVINNDIEKFNYCIKMIDLCLNKMEDFSKRTFFKYIEIGLKGNWCEVNDLNCGCKSYEVWLDIDQNAYEVLCKNVLKKLKIIMLENSPSQVNYN